MTKDEIIKLAREAGIEFDLIDEDEGPIWYITAEGLTRFAALVAAAEREAIAAMIEDAPALVPFSKNDQGGCMVCGFTPKMAAAAIRARGEQK